MKTLNLRHVPNLRAQHLLEYNRTTTKQKGNVSSARDHLHSLWMGPHFGQNGMLLDRDHKTLLEILQCIPIDLVQLDLDLSLLSSQASPQAVQDESDSNDENTALFDNRTNIDDNSSSLSIFGTVMLIILNRLSNLQSLSIRSHGPMVVLGLAQAVPGSFIEMRRRSVLHVLDFRGNGMGDDGVRMLMQALIKPKITHNKRDPCEDQSWTFPNLQHLILSWNSLTDDGVQSLMPLLEPTHKNSRHDGIKCLDLSCNPSLTNVSLNQHLCEALSLTRRFPAAESGWCCPLEQLILFSCRKITSMSSELVQTLSHENFALLKLDLHGTGCDLSCHAWQQIQFSLHLNEVGRLAVLGPPTEKQSKPAASRDGKERDAFHSNLWRTTAEHVKKRKVTTNSNELLNVLLQHNSTKGFSSLDLSTIHYFCRETVHQWCKIQEYENI